MFVAPGSLFQIVVANLVSLGFAFASAWYQPYEVCRCIFNHLWPSETTTVAGAKLQHSRVLPPEVSLATPERRCQHLQGRHGDCATSDAEFRRHASHRPFGRGRLAQSSYSKQLNH